MTVTTSPFTIWHPPTEGCPDGFPMAFPEDTPFEDVVKCAIAYGNGSRIDRNDAIRPFTIGTVINNEFIEED